jgi:hypothetical protein
MTCFCNTILNLQLGMVADTCNQLLQGRDWENCGLRPAWAKVHKTPSEPMAEWGGVQLSFHLGNTNGRITARHKAKPYL